MSRFEAEHAARSPSARALWFVIAATLVGCDSLLGIRDVSPNEPAAGAAGSDGGQSGMDTGGKSGGSMGAAGRGGGGGKSNTGGSGTGGDGTGGSDTNGTDSGGTSGSGGGGGTGGSPLPCEFPIDPGGANDSPKAALAPFGVDGVSSCEQEDRIVFDVSAKGDDDWFKVFGTRGVPCTDIPTPSARVEPAIGATVCYYLEALTGGDIAVTCIDPDVDAPTLSTDESVRGCCGTDKVTPSFPGFEARILISVQPPTEANACTPYTLFLSY